MIPDRNLEILLPIDGVRSCLELGNKREHGQKQPYKAYFERLGVRHVSVDMNGLDGALPLDLRDPLNLGSFDLVTNYGTTEHVSEQEPVWRNIAEACDLLFVSVTPLPGLYPNHGIWYPTQAFYFEFARLNGFKIERMFQRNRDRTGNRVNVHVRMRRVARIPFAMPDRALIVREQMKDKYSERIPQRKEGGRLCVCGLWAADHPCMGLDLALCSARGRLRSMARTGISLPLPGSSSPTDDSTTGKPEIARDKHGNPIRPKR